MGYYAADIGESLAEFEYGPFGELIRATGEKKDDFNFRFSTKYEDAETGLLYYGYRYYDSENGRWLSRDPIGERGGLNLYGFIGNDGINDVDLLGLVSVTHFNDGQYRLDSEVPKAGEPKGGIHIQDNKTNEKFRFDPETGEFKNSKGKTLSRRTLKKFGDNQRFKNAVGNAVEHVNKSGGFKAVGRFVGTIGFAGSIVSIANGEPADFNPYTTGEEALQVLILWEGIDLANDPGVDAIDFIPNNKCVLSGYVQRGSRKICTYSCPDGSSRNVEDNCGRECKAEVDF